MGIPHHFGIYYSPTAGPYRQADLQAFLPHINATGAKWVMLKANSKRAVPEAFVRGLIDEGFTPVIHLDAPPSPDLEREASPLLHAYSRWGVKYICFFDAPNRRAFWGKAWQSGNLPELFLDAFLPLAESAHAHGITPILPPLLPGGDYWDTAFLRHVLEGVVRRAKHLIPSLALGAYAWSEGKPLDWGAGGPEAWPEALPYFTPEGSQDQRGFRVFEWYAAHARAVWNREPKIFLIGMGWRYGQAPSEEVEKRNAEIARMFRQGELPDYILGGAFWALTAPEGDEIAWVAPDGSPKPIIAKVGMAAQEGQSEGKKGVYVLLPRKNGRVPAAHLGAALAWLQNTAATVGSIPQEALRAEEIIIIGSPADYPPQVRAQLSAHPKATWLPPAGTYPAPE